nr:MAG TPA: hypothetical protein [Caudoviricetes sp.]
MIKGSRRQAGNQTPGSKESNHSYYIKGRKICQSKENRKRNTRSQIKTAEKPFLLIYITVHKRTNVRTTTGKGKRLPVLVMGIKLSTILYIWAVRGWRYGIQKKICRRL